MKDDITRKTWMKGLIFVLVAALINGILPSVTQKGLSLGLPIESILFYRYIIGTVLLWIYIFIKREKIAIGFKPAFFSILLGLFLYMAIYCMNESYLYIPGAISSMIVFLYPAIVVIMDIVSGREPLRISRVICLILTILGLVIVVWSPGDSQGVNSLGILFSVAAAVFFAFQTFGMGAKIIKNVSAIVISGYLTLIPFVGSVLRYISIGDFYTPETFVQWGLVIFIAIFGVCVSTICYCSAVKLIGSSDTSIIDTIEPVVAYFGGIIIMSHIITPKATLGGIVIISSILILNITKKLNLPGIRRSRADS